MALEPAGVSSADSPAVAEKAPATPGGDRGVFVRRVAGVMTTRMALFVMAFATSILISRLLGTDGRGVYVAVVAVPGMLSALGMFGLPSAVNYFAGRGMSLRSLIRASYLFTVVLSVILVGIVWFGLPALESSFLKAAKDYDGLLRLILLTIPLGMLATFGGTILYGRQAVRVYNLVQIAMAAVSLLCVLVLVGALHRGVGGAVAGSVIVSTLTAVAVMIAVHRLARSHSSGPPARLHALISYGARLYPASITGYFNYRADTLIIQALLLNPKGPLGLYSFAVTMAEVVFYVPDSISTLFLPRVAGSTPEDANRIVGRVGRMTTLLTIGVALALIPAAFAGIYLVLPDFADCLPAFLVLLPGVVSLSVAKVMTSYIGGRGRPGLVSVQTIAALFLNVALNIFLIPRLGIVGASLASLISYSAQAAIVLFFASRLSGQSPLSLFVPGRAEVQLLVDGLRRLWARAKASDRMKLGSRGGR